MAANHKQLPRLHLRPDVQDVVDLCTVLAEVLHRPFWVAGAWSERALGRAVEAVGAPMIVLVADPVGEVVAHLADVGFGVDEPVDTNGVTPIALSDREERRIVLVPVTVDGGGLPVARSGEASADDGEARWLVFSGQLEDHTVRCALPSSELREVDRTREQTAEPTRLGRFRRRTATAEEIARRRKPPL